MLVKKIVIISLLSISIAYAANPANTSAKISTKQPTMEKTTTATSNNDETYADTSKPIVLTQQKSSFVIKLPANRTTGYQWFYLADKSNSLVVPVKQEYVLSDNTNKKVGSGGFSIWHFEVDPGAFKVPTISHVTLGYARSWEMVSPVKIVELTIVTQ